MDFPGKSTAGCHCLLCGSDHELLIAKFRLKLKKVKKTTIPFRYDLNQIPYDYTVEVTNRLKGLDLVNRVPEELGTEVHNTVQEAVNKTIPKKKKCNTFPCINNISCLPCSEKALVTHSSTLAWKIPRMEEPGRL